MTKEELEKEAEKFLGGWLIDPEIVKLLVDFAEPREKRIAELEKENAELKEEMNAKQVVLNDFKSRVETVTDRFNKKSSQLTKAKEIIRKFMKYEINEYDGSLEIHFEELKKQAEQFLKE